MEEYTYRMQVSTLDCTGCGNCADICPAKEKALVMSPFEEENKMQAQNWYYAVDKLKHKELNFNKYTIKGSQFNQPLLQFSGACAGCGETAYSKLVTQLYGDRMLIANASGCPSIWGGSSPSSSFTKNHEGKGPAWASSLFEDNAEFGYGMALATRKMREKLQFLMEEYIEMSPNTARAKDFKHWIETISNKIINGFKEKETDDRLNNILKEIENKKDYLNKKSVWITGGENSKI